MADQPLFEVHGPDGQKWKLWLDGRAEGFPSAAVIVNRAASTLFAALGRRRLPSEHDGGNQVGADSAIGGRPLSAGMPISEHQLCKMIGEEVARELNARQVAQDDDMERIGNRIKVLYEASQAARIEIPPPFSRPGQASAAK